MHAVQFRAALRQGRLVIWEVQTLRHPFVTFAFLYDHRDEDDNDGDYDVLCWLEVVSSLMNNFAFASLVWYTWKVFFLSKMMILAWLFCTIAMCKPDTVNWTPPPTHGSTTYKAERYYTEPSQPPFISMLFVVVHFVYLLWPSALQFIHLCAWYM